MDDYCFNFLFCLIFQDTKYLVAFLVVEDFMASDTNDKINFLTIFGLVF